jgi:hypothetical protein
MHLSSVDINWYKVSYFITEKATEMGKAKLEKETQERWGKCYDS